MNPLFSVIIPFYNSEKYLFECIDSIVKQKSSNLEIILIDDNSIDNSIKIAESFAKKNNNIKIIQNKRNEGVSICRNKGIVEAKGKYVVFIDSDDFLVKKSFKKLEQFIEDKEQFDIIILTKYIRKSENKFLKDEIFTPRKSIFKKNNFIIRFYKNRSLSHTCWNYIFDRNFLLKNKLNFIRNVNIGEDQLLIAKSFCCGKKFLFYKNFFYCKRLGVGSLSSKMGYEPCVDFLKVINEMCIFMKKRRLVGNKSEFMHERIRDPLIEIIPRFILLNNKDILKLFKFIKKNSKNLRILNNKVKKNKVFSLLEKGNSFQDLLNYKRLIVEKIKKLVKDKNYKKIYIFSKSFFGIATAKILLDLGYPVKGFFDNSKILSVNYKSKLKVFSPNGLIKKSKKELFKLFFIISNQQKRDVRSITAQLKKYNIRTKQITNINFSK